MATSKGQSRAGLPVYLLLSGGLLFSGIGSDLCVAQTELYSEAVTDADLAATSAEDWLSFRGNLASWGYSALDQIDRTNVDRLAFAWSATMATGPNEPSPLIRDGVLYLPHSGDVIQALDARNGDLLWEYRRQWPEEIRSKRNMASLGRPINRSLAIHGNALYATTGDAYVIRLNAHTGELEWETKIGDATQLTHTSGPLIADGKVISGRACDTSLPGGCFITAHNAEDGSELWRFYVVARPGEPGGDTWGGLPLEKRIQVGAWFVGSYDPELDLLYWGTSVPAPSPEVLRGTGKGAMLYSNSTLALDPDSGELQWYFQHLPRDNWDLDHPFERMLVELEVEPDPDEVWVQNPNIESEGKRRLLTGVPGKNGIVWTLDRVTGEFLWARETVYQNVVASIDPVTGSVAVNEEVIPKSFEDEYGIVCPHAGGGRNWPTASFSPRTEAIYVPLQNLCMSVEMTTPNPGPGDYYAISGRSQMAPGKDKIGRLQAVSARTGKTLWQFETGAGMYSSLSTAGDLVFAGDSNRRFRAFDAETGDVLWQSVLNGPVTGFPASYAVDGEQYVVVAVGGGDLLSGGHNRRAGNGVKAGSNALYAFKLASGRQPSPPRAARSPTVPRQPAASAEATADIASDGTSTPCLSFNEMQAQRGRVVYQERCVACHGEQLRGGSHGSALAGGAFVEYWDSLPASDLFQSIQDTMPPGEEGTLSPREVDDLIALVLEVGGVESDASSELIESNRSRRLCLSGP